MPWQRDPLAGAEHDHVAAQARGVGAAPAAIGTGAVCLGQHRADAAARAQRCLGRGLQRRVSVWRQVLLLSAHDLRLACLDRAGAGLPVVVLPPDAYRGKAKRHSPEPQRV